MLRYLDYELIKQNPKILCGFSDITTLNNALYAKTGLVSYSGPHFSTFGMEKGMEYTIDYVKKCLFSSERFEVKPSSEWSDDRWWIDQENRNFIPNPGYVVLNEGSAGGKILGGNLCTLNLLQGTEFMPDLDESVLFIEDYELATPVIFDRDLQSLIHQPGFDGVCGIVIGRFQKASEMSDKLLKEIIKSKRELDGIPVIANADFGHTAPLITFPVGGRAKLYAKDGEAKLEIIEH